MVDLDPQANATSSLGIDPKSLKANLYQALIDNFSPEDITKDIGIFNYKIIPSSSDLAGATVELVGLENREFKLKEALSRLQAPYDYVLIDCPPSLCLLTVNGLVASDKVIIPVQCEYFALNGLSQLLDTISLVGQGLNPSLKILGALLTMHDRRTKLSWEVMKEVRRNFPGYVFDAVIPKCVSLAEAPRFGKTIFQYAPQSEGANAYRQLAQEIIELENNNNQEDKNN